MEFFEAVRKRRSIRRFKQDVFPSELVQKAFEAAVLAPNSSNIQSWDFHWVTPTSSLKAKIIEACLGQSAAKTASHIVVITANPKLWKRSQKPLIEWVKAANAPKPVIMYYEKLIPIMYRFGFLNILAPIKFLVSFCVGLFRPMTRGPYTFGGSQVVAIKSAALAAENFVLAIAAQGGATCMMEGFDEWRMKCALKLSCSTRVVMAIGVGYEAEKGTWGPQYRLPLDQVLHKYD